MFQEIPGGGKAVVVSPYHELAEAIRRGCKLRPVKVRERFVAFKGACALGAAGIASNLDDISWSDLERIFPCLRQWVTYPIDPTRRLPLVEIIVALNDGSDWSREKIADWLDQLPCD